MKSYTYLLEEVKIIILEYPNILPTNFCPIIISLILSSGASKDVVLNKPTLP